MTTNQVITILKERKKDFLETKTYSQLPGIYAFFYIGDEFPLLGDSVKKNQLIYIGKTESSQEKRDAKTHFSTGKTGSSTVRKSIGAILNTSNKLNPIPRNNIDFEKRRYSHFKFDTKSEEIITDWMKNNLALSFYEYPKTKQEIEDLETKIILELVPILNISKNPNNLFKDNLQQLRKNCAQIAAKNFSQEIVKKENVKIYKPQKTFVNMMSTGKYYGIWTKNRQLIKLKLQLASTRQSIQLNSNEFKAVGNRKSYSFNLEFINGIVSNNISGSAVARDLANVLENSQEIKSILKSGSFKFNMDTNYCLWIERNS